MAWCRQITGHYMSQWWPRPISPHGVTRPRWHNILPLLGRAKLLPMEVEIQSPQIKLKDIRKEKNQDKTNENTEAVININKYFEHIYSKLFSTISKPQNYPFRIDPSKVYQRRSKRSIHGTTRRKDNQSQKLKQPCKLSWLGKQTRYTGAPTNCVLFSRKVRGLKNPCQVFNLRHTININYTCTPKILAQQRTSKHQSHRIWWGTAIRMSNTQTIVINITKSEICVNSWDMNAHAKHHVKQTEPGWHTMWLWYKQPVN